MPYISSVSKSWILSDLYLYYILSCIFNIYLIFRILIPLIDYYKVLADAKRFYSYLSPSSSASSSSILTMFKVEIFGKYSFSTKLILFFERKAVGGFVVLEISTVFLHYPKYP